MMRTVWNAAAFRAKSFGERIILPYGKDSLAGKHVPQGGVF
jgi:hypothetical protein